MLFPQAIFWDVDGTLIHNEFLHREKLIVTAGKYGVRLCEKDFAIRHDFQIPDGNGAMKDVNIPLHGAGDKNIYYWVVAQKPELKKRLPLDVWLDDLFDYYRKNKNKIQPRENIADVVDAFRNLGVIQGIVTSGTPLQVEVNLDVIPGVISAMSFIVDSDSVTKHKPHPEPYNVALAKLAKLGTDPSCVAVVAVEDSPTGVPSAMDAGTPSTGERVDCVQFLLPGQDPVDNAEQYGGRLVVAKTVAQVKAGIHSLFARRQQELNDALRASRPGGPASRKLTLSLD